LARVQQGDLGFRLPPLAGYEAQAIGAAFNRMAQGVQDKVSAEQKALEAEARLEERRELASMADQRVEEERRLIAHELHDEFGQSVTAIRSLAVAIKNRVEAKDAETADVARLISDEAGRLYDAMHGLIPRLTPLTLDTLGLSDTLENLVRDWQRRHPETVLHLTRELKQELNPTVALTVYRVVQESVINALRHSQALRIDIEVISDEQRIRVTVADNGVGLPADWLRAGHYGLRGLKDRVDQLGGNFSIGAGNEHCSSRGRSRRGANGVPAAAAGGGGCDCAGRGGFRRIGLPVVCRTRAGRHGDGFGHARHGRLGCFAANPRTPSAGAGPDSVGTR
jgi:two-component system sensor histidine kinase UhpB